MNANIVLSVKGRKVIFKPRAYLKWTITLPIESVEVMCETAHHFERIGYVPRNFQEEMCVTVMSDKWNLPTCEKIEVPMINDKISTYQIYTALFNGCHTNIIAPINAIKKYVEWLRIRCIETNNRKYIYNNVMKKAVNNK